MQSMQYVTNIISHVVPTSTITTSALFQFSLKVVVMERLGVRLLKLFNYCFLRGSRGHLPACKNTIKGCHHAMSWGGLCADLLDVHLWERSIDRKRTCWGELVKVNRGRQRRETSERTSGCSLHSVVALLKKHYVSLGGEIQTQHFYIYNINEVIVQTRLTQINKLFSEENKSPTTPFEARKMAGSATYRQSKTVWICVVL